jgi:hypothetical protein
MVTGQILVSGQLQVEAGRLLVGRVFLWDFVDASAAFGIETSTTGLDVVEAFWQLILSISAELSQ